MPDVLSPRVGDVEAGARRQPPPAPDRPRGPRAAGRAERLVFRVAMVAAALWVLDDAYWHREPGTSVGEHLASGLVPVTLAALLALAYPRLRPGARAAGALSAGALMIVAGVVDGARHLAVDRLSGDDVTALLAGVAGALLAPIYTLSPYIGGNFILAAFAVVVLGGLGSVPGAYIGGLMVGLMESFAGYYVDPALKQAIWFIIFVIVLVVRPSGLMGQAGAEEVGLREQT